jgi:hypothetical protein
VPLALVAVRAMPSSALLSTSPTLSTSPEGLAKSTRLETSVPTAPEGAPGSSATVASAGDLLASSTGASLTGVPVKLLVPVMASATPSLTLVATVKSALKLVAGVKVTPASSVLTSAMAPEAVQRPVTGS